MVGAGYIAVEMAGIFKSLGSDVTLILRKDKALRSFDTMIVDTVTEELEHLGINLGQAHHIFSRFLNLRIYEILSRNFLGFVFLQDRSFLLRSKMPL